MRSALVVLKQRRFELAAAVLGCVVIAIWGLTIKARYGSLGVPRECLELLVSGRPAGPACPATLGSWSSLAGEASRIVAVMGYLPFAVGLVGGVPVVASEIESRTAQTAWSLCGSRIQWFARQLLPVMLLLGLAVTVAALVTEAVQNDRGLMGEPGFPYLGSYGAPAIARAVGAFGLGLLIGTVAGRTLPALAVAAVVCVALVSASGMARDIWLERLEPLPPSTLEGRDPSGLGIVITQIAWRSPDGTLLSREAAREVATAAGVPPAEPGDAQDQPALDWYEANGYTEVPLGVPEATAEGWGIYDSALFGGVGAITVLVAGATVVRRRPS